MSDALAKIDNSPDAIAIEQALVQGNLANLTPYQRVMYYHKVCESVGLNPLTKPFDYITLNGKLTLYARKDCTDQLRKRDSLSIRITARELMDGVFVVTASASDSSGRTDEAIGAVPLDKLQGEARANAMMKAETKAKRRVTLSFCGLGFVDESEVDSIPAARVHHLEEMHRTPDEPARGEWSECPKGMRTEEPDPLAPWAKFLNDDPTLELLNGKLTEFATIPKDQDKYRKNVWGMLSEYAKDNEWIWDTGLKSFAPFVAP